MLPHPVGRFIYCSGVGHPSICLPSACHLEQGLGSYSSPQKLDAQGICLAQIKRLARACLCVSVLGRGRARALFTTELPHLVQDIASK